MALTASANFFSQPSEWSELSTETNTEMPSPILFWSTSATRRRITPSASNRWMRFQQGVDDSPTRSPISATEREASSCSTIRILRSIASRRRLLGSGSWVTNSLMRRTLSRLRGYSTSSGENSSISSPLLRTTCRRRCRVLPQKLLNFSTLRCREGAPEAGAFQGCGRRGDAQGLAQLLSFGDRQGERAVEHVAGPQRIHRMYREGRGLLQLSIFVEPDRAARAAGARQKRGRQFRELPQCLAVVPDPGRLLQGLAGKHQMRGGGQKSFTQRHRVIDIDDHRNTAPAGFRAEIGAKRRAAAFGQDRVAVLQELLCRRQSYLPQFRIAEGDDGTFAARVDHDVRDRRHQAVHVNYVAGVDPLMCQLLENVAAGGFAGVAHRPADRCPAAQPHNSDCAVQGVTPADFLKMAGMLLGTARGKTWHAKGQVAHGHADTEDERRNPGCLGLKVHARVRHVCSWP